MTGNDHRRNARRDRADIMKEAPQAEEFLYEGQARDIGADVLQAGIKVPANSPALCMVPRECWNRVCSAEG